MRDKNLISDLKRAAEKRFELAKIFREKAKRCEEEAEEFRAAASQISKKVGA